jgi:CRISPR system Cascade subunit CasB
LRRGVGREAGSVPEMWAFYTTLNPDGHLTRELRAEHIALTMFSVHQQSHSQPVHRVYADVAAGHERGFGLGSAVLTLRNSRKYTPEAVDRRFAAAATATSVNELRQHLHGLIIRLHGLSPQPGLDYTQLYRDLLEWQFPDGPARVRRRWGGSYVAGAAEPTRMPPAPANT